MERLRAFQYESAPMGAQRQSMSRFAGCKRVVCNKALNLQTANYANGDKYIRYESLAKCLGMWRVEQVWLREAPYHTLQQGLKDLDRAFRNFFAQRASYPARKKKGRGDSFRFADPKQIKLDQANDRIFLHKLGWLRYRNSREVLGDVKNVTVSASNDKWFISIQTEREVVQPSAHGAAVGIDMGVVRFATLSDGTFVPPLNIFMCAVRPADREAFDRSTRVRSKSQDVPIPAHPGRVRTPSAPESAG